MRFTIAFTSHFIVLTSVCVSAPQNNPVPGEAKSAKPQPAKQLDSSGDVLPPHAVARLGSTRLLHPREVMSVIFTRDGKSLITSSPNDVGGRRQPKDGIFLWDPWTGQLLRKLGGFFHGPGRITLSPDGKYLATESGASVVGIMEIGTGKVLSQIRWAGSGNVIAVSFSPDAKTLALTGAGSEIQIWDTLSGEVLQRFGPNGGWAIAYSPDGQSLASTGEQKIYLWNPGTGKEIWRFDERTDHSFLSALQFSHDGKLIAVGAKKDVLLLDAKSGKEVRRWDAPGIEALAFSPDDSLLATGSNGGTVQVWAVSSGKQIRKMSGHRGTIYSVDFSPDGKLLASGGQDQRARVWVVETGKELVTTSGHQTLVDAVAYSPDGKVIASAGFDGTLLEWDWRANQVLKVHKDVKEPLSSIVYSPDGKLLAVACWDANIRLYQPGVGLKHVLKGHKPEHYIYTLAMDPSGKFLASASIDSTIRLWDMTTFKEVRKFEGGAVWKWVQSLAFFPNGRVLASGREDGTVHLTDVESGKLLQKFPPPSDTGEHDTASSIAFIPGGERLVVANREGSIRLLEAASGRELIRYKGLDGQHHCIAIAPDGWYFVSGEGDGQLFLWETVTGNKVLSLKGQNEEITSVAFAPDGRTFTSGSRDHSVLVWDATGFETPSAGSSAALSDKEFAKPWQDLASNDALVACRAIWKLRSFPREVAKFLSGKLTAAPAEPAQQISKWILELDDSRFSVRENAAQSLEKLQEQALPALRKALASSKSGEVRRRCQLLLDKFIEKPLSPETLRELRALVVLEYTNVPESEQVLVRLSQGGGGALLTREANKSLERMRKSSPPR